MSEVRGWNEGGRNEEVEWDFGEGVFKVKKDWRERENERESECERYREREREEKCLYCKLKILIRS